MLKEGSTRGVDSEEVRIKLEPETEDLLRARGITADNIGVMVTRLLASEHPLILLKELRQTKGLQLSAAKKIVDLARLYVDNIPDDEVAFTAEAEVREELLKAWSDYPQSLQQIFAQGNLTSEDLIRLAEEYPPGNELEPGDLNKLMSQYDFLETRSQALQLVRLARTKASQLIEERQRETRVKRSEEHDRDFGNFKGKIEYLDVDSLGAKLLDEWGLGKACWTDPSIPFEKWAEGRADRYRLLKLLDEKGYADLLREWCESAVLSGKETVVAGERFRNGFDLSELTRMNLLLRLQGRDHFPRIALTQQEAEHIAGGPQPLEQILRESTMSMGRTSVGLLHTSVAARGNALHPSRYEGEGILGFTLRQGAVKGSHRPQDYEYTLSGRARDGEDLMPILDDLADGQRGFQQDGREREYSAEVAGILRAIDEGFRERKSVKLQAGLEQLGGLLQIGSEAIFPRAKVFVHDALAAAKKDSIEYASLSLEVRHDWPGQEIQFLVRAHELIYYFQKPQKGLTGHWRKLIEALGSWNGDLADRPRYVEASFSERIGAMQGKERTAWFQKKFKQSDFDTIARMLLDLNLGKASKHELDSVRTDACVALDTLRPGMRKLLHDHLRQSSDIPASYKATDIKGLMKMLYNA